jgi:CRP/FNR family transcriptional regulator, cyclic AMP receptor protein
MEDVRERIKRVGFFAALSDRELDILSRIARITRYRKHYTVVEEEEVRDALYIVMKGRVKVVLYDESGKEYVVDVIETGGFFGELSLFDELSGFVNIITLEESQLLMIRRSDFIRLLRENPDFTLSVLRTLTARLRAANEKLKGLAFLNVEQRILGHLREIGQKRGILVKDRLIIEKGPTQVEIASACGCSRETVSRTIKSLAKKGRLSVLRKQYTLRPDYQS